MENTLDLLLGGKELPKPEASYKIARLSKELGGDIVFRLRALAYDDVADIKKRENDEMGVHIVLEGCCCRARSRICRGRLRCCPGSAKRRSARLKKNNRGL